MEEVLPPKSTTATTTPEQGYHQQQPSTQQQQRYGDVDSEEDDDDDEDEIVLAPAMAGLRMGLGGEAGRGGGCFREMHRKMCRKINNLCIDTKEKKSSITISYSSLIPYSELAKVSVACKSGYPPLVTPIPFPSFYLEKPGA